jgi:hypothetical protein
MVILGDIASPNKISSSRVLGFLQSNKAVFEDTSILFNLEGLISDNQSLEDNSPILFNHSSILVAFDAYDNKIAALANNHTLDLPHLLDTTKKTLESSGFKSVGAGNINDANFKITEIIEKAQRIFIINACWDFLLYHQDNNNTNTKVHTIDEYGILEMVKQLKVNYPDSKVLTYFHWSFDLEIIPSPSYRVFAKDLIDAGVSLVVGGHSHCVQGGEKYKHGYIVYGLGNFYLPSGIYANGKLKFPAMSDVGCVLKWDVVSNTLQNIWISSASNELKLLEVDTFENSETLKKYSSFAGMSDDQYVKYFIENRRKNKLNPVFYNYNKSNSNLIKMKLLKTRAKIARKAAEWNLISWQN